MLLVVGCLCMLVFVVCAWCCLLIVARHVLFVVCCLFVDVSFVFSWLLFGVWYEFVV